MLLELASAVDPRRRLTGQSGATGSVSTLLAPLGCSSRHQDHGCRWISLLLPPPLLLLLLLLLLDSLPWRRRFNSSIRSGGRSILLGRRFGGSGLLRLLRLLRLLLRQTSLLLLQQLEQVRRGTQQ